MSPEQASGDLDRLGPRSDVYSLGATLYCLLTGKPPFEGDDLGAILRKVQAGRLRPARGSSNRRWTRPLEALCLKAMANKPGTVTPRAGPWPTTWSGGWPTFRSRRGPSRGRGNCCAG